MRAPEFWTSRAPGARALALALSPLGALYGLRTRTKRHLARPYRADAGVICVGNLTAGGTGKTPVALALARALMARGRRPMFLTRGHGGRLRGPLAVATDRHTARDVGDEALLLAAVAPTIVARDRAAGARLAERMGADVIVMDDGFQNFSVEKDLPLVVADAPTGFGNGHLIPAGPLREGIIEGLARAKAVILMGDGDPPLHGFAGPVLRARLAPAEPDIVRGQRVLAFAGIGRPEKFFETLRAMGAVVAAAHPFADHHRFTRGEIRALLDEAHRSHFLPVTTEKDFVRLPDEERQGIVPVAVHAVFDDELALDHLLDGLDERRHI